MTSTGSTQSDIPSPVVTWGQIEDRTSVSVSSDYYPELLEALAKNAEAH